MSRELNVWLEDDRAGRLHENNGIWSIDYDARWLAEGFPLATGMPAACSNASAPSMQRQLSIG